MLTHLSIKNYALIDNIAVDFKDKLTIITGETGAGKSILLGGLGLVLGKRADSSTLKFNEKKCVIEAQFFIANYKLAHFFKERDIDFEEETIIRREILPNGKSRAFINDTPTTLQVLSELGEKLIDVHSQHQTLQLSDVYFQFQILDALAGHADEIEMYKKTLHQYRIATKEFKELLNDHELAKQQYAYNLHLYEELVNTNLEENEQEQIEQSLDKLNNIEEIKLNLSEAHSLAMTEELGILDRLTLFHSKLRKIGPYGKEYDDLNNRIESLKIEFDDIANEIGSLNENINFDNSALEKLNDRLQLLHDLQKKHLVVTVAELIQIQQKLSIEVASVENGATLISEKETALKIIEQKIDKLAESIFHKRKKTIPVFIAKLENILLNLGMGNTRFKMDVTHTNEYFQNGKDQLQFLISANKGASFGPLKKIASGGELSRIMLAIKSILSEYLMLPTIIFDEIDAGVSGDISQKMAGIMQQLGEHMQVISITHLPQIAAKGQQHYKIYKLDKENNIVTQLKALNEQERIVEIAEMLGSKNITNTAIDHAKQLLN